MADQEASRQRIGVQGWREFAAARLELLNEHRLAQLRASSRPVNQTEPGVVAEAVFRRWLMRFLPARYGVTSGFIVSTGRTDREPLKHFDVIIYDKLNAPILWRGGNPDKSDQGDELGIPVEYVLAVFEVKVTLTAKSVRDTAKKLTELAPLLQGVDEEGTYAPKYLPRSFVSGMVFFGAHEDVRYRASALFPIIECRLNLPRGFMNNIILSSPDDPARTLAAQINIMSGEDPFNSTVGKGKQSLFYSSPTIGSLPSGAHHVGLLVGWSDNSFAAFAMDLVAQLRGTFKLGHMSSLYGMNFYAHEGDARFPLDSEPYEL